MVLRVGAETVADPGFRQDPARSVWVVFQLAPQASHVYAQRVIGHAGTVSPDGGKQLPVRPDGTWPGKKRRQQREFRRRQVERPPGLPDLPRLAVDVDVPKSR